jgi:RNA polymerase sigma factor (sigma-70 family)
MDSAITGHTPLVHSLARRLVQPGSADWDDVISDGMLALWQALQSYDPDRWALDRYLAVRIRHRLIDGLRQRTGRGERPTVISLSETPGCQGNLSALDSRPGDWHPTQERDPRDPASPIDAAHSQLHAEALIRQLAQVDPRLPDIARKLLDGYTRTEIAADFGLSRTRVWQLLTLAAEHLNQPERLTA